jgi:hypothetical protein
MGAASHMTPINNGGPTAPVVDRHIPEVIVYPVSEADAAKLRAVDTCSLVNICG